MKMKSKQQQIACLKGEFRRHLKTVAAPTEKRQNVAHSFRALRGLVAHAEQEGQLHLNRAHQEKVNG